MRRTVGYGMVILVMALLCGASAFWVTRSQKMHAAHGAVIDQFPELTWMRREFDLSDEQFAKVSELHEAYRPRCEEMCDRIRDSHEELDRLARQGRALSPELGEAIEDHARIHAECQREMVQHLYDTAAILDEEQSRRYLEAMLPFALDFSHSEPDGVHGP